MKTQLITPKSIEAKPPDLVVTTMSPTTTHAFPQSMSWAPTWISLTPTQPRTAASVPCRIPTPSIRPPSPPLLHMPSPQLAQTPQTPTEGYNDPLQGKEPSVFNENRLRTDKFLHKLQLYQFMNKLHPIMQNPWCKVTYALIYLTEPNTYKWKQSVENWIMSIPASALSTCTIYSTTWLMRDMSQFIWMTSSFTPQITWSYTAM